MRARRCLCRGSLHCAVAEREPGAAAGGRRDESGARVDARAPVPDSTGLRSKISTLMGSGGPRRSPSHSSVGTTRKSPWTAARRALSGENATSTTLVVE